MRWPDLAAAERAVSAALGAPVRLRGATRPLPLAHLSPGERAAWGALPPAGRRRADWLRGRAALKLLLAGADTCDVAFPHPGVSLTHSGELAVAAGAGGQLGFGVDFEAAHAVDARAARFFLHPHERAEGGELLRLWTVKEALYKATPDNGGGGLLDYELADHEAPVGSATDGRGRVFRYASGWLPGGPLTVAACLPARSADVAV